MNKVEAQRATNLALNTSVDLTGEDLSVFDGYGLPNYQPVNVTVRQVARLMRWQCMPIMSKTGPTLLGEELNELVNLGRKRFLIVG